MIRLTPELGTRWDNPGTTGPALWQSLDSHKSQWAMSRERSSSPFCQRSWNRSA